MNNIKRKQLPVGTSDFKKMQLGEYYYDYELSIPNREIKIVYKSEIIKNVHEEWKIFQLCQ